MQQKINIIVLIIAVLLLRNDLFCQHAEKLPALNYTEEKMHVHLSQMGVFTSEIIWFKVYCVSSLFSGEELSTLAFVELVSIENASILRKKILLKNGEGLGEFEIPENLPTGLYYILAYTNWMKNFGEESFFRKEIVIINPNHPINNTFNDLDSVKKSVERAVNIIDTNNLKIILSKRNYSTREQLTLKIETGSLPRKAIPGHFSVSVFRKEPAMIFNNKISKDEVLIKDPEKIVFLPDYKGLRLTGRLSDPSDNAVSGANVTASMPGPGTEIKSSISDGNGEFHFLLKPKEGEQDIVITLHDADTKISFEESFWNGFRDPPDNLLFGLDQKAISYLNEKFTHFQLQKRFKKQCSIKNIPVKNPEDSSVFFSMPYQLIKLSNYINLDSLREYFYELVPSVKFIHRKGESDITVIDQFTLTNLEEKPGVFLDGVLYDNYAGIANVPVREIDRMAIIPNTYYYKNFTFGGIIDIHTKKSDFNSVKLLPNMTRFFYQMANQSEWIFSPPDYSIADPTNRLPDFRYLLYWDPKVKVESSGEATVRFFTGDVKGTFVIRVVGTSEGGELLEAENEIIIDD